MSLLVHRYNNVPHTPGIKQLDKITDTNKEINSIDQLSWGPYLSTPETQFNIGYSEYGLWLKFFVSESTIRAKYTRTNDPVYQDSCVEFFLRLNEDGPYYNFEFNSIGTCLAQVGTSRNNREFLSHDQIKGVIRYPSLGTKPIALKSGVFNWELSVFIPREIFYLSVLKCEPGTQLWANFYKCGDQLTEPHYLSWKKIGTEQPDFHQPEFFGKLIFE